MLIRVKDKLARFYKCDLNFWGMNIDSVALDFIKAVEGDKVVTHLSLNLSSSARAPGISPSFWASVS